MECIYKYASNNSSIVGPAYQKQKGRTIPNHCLATTGDIHIQTHRLLAGIYEVCHWDGLRCPDTYTKFHRDWFRRSKADGADTQPCRQNGNLTSLLRKVGQKYFITKSKEINKIKIKIQIKEPFSTTTIQSPDNRNKANYWNTCQMH
jgi:hypothetical protein